ncbi:MAG TPA: alpha/beta hydrolase [Actinomycetales bacterium]|nr:alpha/beta hydrolase [Actinomycetales bacterium]
MPDSLTTDLLDVPGAKLYYEVRGSGPLLLVIGQPMTSEPFGPMAGLLAADHTVVTYDPRGLGQSTVEDPSSDVTPQIQADDLARLLDAVGGGPADVFASSGGAVTGLALAVRHPAQVRLLVAHEPPVTELLPDAEHVRALVDEIEEAYRAGGNAPAWGKFVSLVMHDGLVTADGVPPASWPPGGADSGGAEKSAGQDTGQAPPEPSQKQLADDELFFLRMLKPFTRYEPDVDALRSGRPRVLIAVGEMSRGEVAARSARALAEQLGIPTTAFPGHHGGFMDDPEAFASRLRETLS